MFEPRWVVCGGSPTPAVPIDQILQLDRTGSNANVHLRIDDIRSGTAAHLSDVLSDLCDVAVYVYAADQSIARGSLQDTRFGERWRRDLRFCIPVRVPELWNSPAVQTVLVELLEFLSDFFVLNPYQLRTNARSALTGVLRSWRQG